MTEARHHHLHLGLVLSVASTDCRNTRPQKTELTMMLDRDLFEFIEHTTDAAFAVTDGGDICSWNSSAEALFGFGTRRGHG